MRPSLPWIKKVAKTQTKFWEKKIIWIELRIYEFKIGFTWIIELQIYEFKIGFTWMMLLVVLSSHLFLVMCVNLVIIQSDNSLAPEWHQTITWIIISKIRVLPSVPFDGVVAANESMMKPEMLHQKLPSSAGISNYIPQILWDVITCPCPWYLLLA